MKKILLIVAIMFAGLTSAMAQTEKGQMGAGLNLLYGTEIENLGVGAKYRYCLTDEFRAEATLDYLFKHDFKTMFDANINMEYLLPIESVDMVTYPILGVGFGNVHTSVHGDKANEGIVGINAGWGIEYAITPKASFNFEAKYQFFNKNCTQLLVGVGLVHKF